MSLSSNQQAFLNYKLKTYKLCITYALESMKTLAKTRPEFGSQFDIYLNVIECMFEKYGNILDVLDDLEPPILNK